MHPRRPLPPRFSASRPNRSSCAQPCTTGPAKFPVSAAQQVGQQGGSGRAVTAAAACGFKNAGSLQSATSVKTANKPLTSYSSVQLNPNSQVSGTVGGSPLPPLALPPSLPPPLPAWLSLLLLALLSPLPALAPLCCQAACTMLVASREAATPQYTAAFGQGGTRRSKSLLAGHGRRGLACHSDTYGRQHVSMAAHRSSVPGRQLMARACVAVGGIDPNKAAASQRHGKQPAICLRLATQQNTTHTRHCHSACQRTNNKRQSNKLKTHSGRPRAYATAPAAPSTAAEPAASGPHRS